MRYRAGRAAGIHCLCKWVSEPAQRPSGITALHVVTRDINRLEFIRIGGVDADRLLVKHRVTQRTGDQAHCRGGREYVMELPVGRLWALEHGASVPLKTRRKRPQFVLMEQPMGFLE